MGIGPELRDDGDGCPAGKRGEIGEISSSRDIVYPFPVVEACGGLKDMAECMPGCSAVVTVAMFGRAAPGRRGGCAARLVS